METDRSAMVRDNRQISIQLELLANRVMAQKGLTTIQAHMLLYILAHSAQGTSLTDIHREFGYSMAALSGLVKRLAEKGYVRVEPCVRDEPAQAALRQPARGRRSGTFWTAPSSAPRTSCTGSSAPRSWPSWTNRYTYSAQPVRPYAI